LKILSADFVTSATGTEDGIPRDDLPQIALAGRSNVGKSTLINALARRKIARTSAAPGKTRLVNFYRVEFERVGRHALYLVDLPGYGYARGGANAAAELRAVAEAYLVERRAPSADERRRAAFLLVDARHPQLESDRAAAEWLTELGIDTHIVATKIDKLTRSERARNLKTLGDTFGRAVLPVSAESGEGLDELWRTIVRIARAADRDE
jgi:GTP-binding protein